MLPRSSQNETFGNLPLGTAVAVPLGPGWVHKPHRHLLPQSKLQPLPFPLRDSPGTQSTLGAELKTKPFLFLAAKS